jgi:predicted nucleotidyltransferase
MSERYTYRMTIDHVQSLLASHRGRLDELGITCVRVFGSCARGEHTPSSDLDLLVDFDHPVGLLELATAKIELEGILGVKVDLTTAGMLREELREQVMAEAKVAA